MSAIERHRGAAVAAALASVAVALTFRDYARLDPRPLTGDGALFLLGGLKTAQGHVPYLHLWDVKPPGIHLTAGVLAVVSGGSRQLLYVLGNAANGVALVGSCLLAGVIVSHVTGRQLPALAAGASPLAYQATYEFVPAGIRPKYFLGLFGLLSMYLLLKRRPFLSGAAAALVASYWQLGVVFPAVAVAWALAERRRGRTDAVAVFR